MIYEKLASAIYNDVMSGLRGYSSTPTLSLEQLEDDIVDERLIIIKEYSLKGILPKKDLLLSLNCIPVDCESLERCKCYNSQDEVTAHFEIPQIALDFGSDAIEYIGSVNRQNPFVVYTNSQFIKYHNYRKRSNTPYVWIDTTPNENNMNDGFIFNSPLLKTLSAVFIPKDPRQLNEFICCPSDEINNLSFLNNEIKRRLTEKKIRYYRQLAIPLNPNDQSPK